MPKIYSINQTIPTTFINKRGQAVNGYTVHFTLLRWNEAHEMRVESLDPSTLDSEIRKLNEQRQSLDKLGEDKA